ncbi:MAG: hypothetical protein KKG06_04355 [Bacteroidetes bacterium]|nr:hypothetical protein [bacterium]MBU1422405.1 hypothetical protein [Bacteroidota bacterium]
MPNRKRYKYRELRKILKRYGISEDVGRGKGSERTFYHPTLKNGQPVFHTVKCHGEGTQLSIGVIESVRRAFDLSEEEFYG